MSVVDIPAIDGNKIVEDISKIIDSACEKVIETVTSKVGSMLAGLKGDMDVKLAAALRMQTINQHVEDDFTFSPVSSILGIQALSKSIHDEDYAYRFAHHMKKIVGYTPDNCNGLNVCYSLIDNFFDRDLMLHCSWSGGSRGPAPKFAMKSCSNILNTFFEIVYSVNITFSRSLMEHFFKQITRNSKSRCKAKGLRQPTVHRRGKKVACKVQADENNGHQNREERSESFSSSETEREGSEDIGEGYLGEQQESEKFLGFP
ncbi:uncharacterized protein LOC135702213 [Ochlerotatus camptorhynchus]|uniref:uncharacterized protein LOC135702213 n=1 Tax=Ochlerotatus camptorhynchus TaxID=644619 RepID=UPI0031D37B62